MILIQHWDSAESGAPKHKESTGIPVHCLHEHFSYSRGINAKPKESMKKRGLLVLNARTCIWSMWYIVVEIASFHH